MYIKHDLGLVLGINQHKTKAMMDSSTFVDDVIAAWLRREDQVKKKGEPSWTVLVRALEHPREEQCGLSQNIRKDKGLGYCKISPQFSAHLCCILVLFWSKYKIIKHAYICYSIDVMQSPFSGIISMHAIFVTLFHSNNVMLIHFLLSVSALTLLIMDFTILVQIVTCVMQLTIACFPTMKSSTGEWPRWN